jgi:hypothetical protein
VKRGVFNMLAALSLLLCVASAAMWVRSYFAYDLLSRSTSDAAAGNDRRVTLRSSQGCFLIVCDLRHLPPSVYSPAAFRPAAKWEYSSTAKPIGQYQKWYWFAHYPPRTSRVINLYTKASGIGMFDTWGAGCQLLPLAGVLAILPLSAFFIRRKAVPGQCPTCGYDLRATPDRCPECGTAVGPAA